MRRPTTSSQTDSIPARAERLSAKKQLNLIANIAKDMSECGLEPLSSAVLLALACRGLMPSTLAGAPAGQLLERLSRDYFGAKKVQIDDSEFADYLVRAQPTNSDELFDSRLFDKQNFQESERSQKRFERFSQSLSKPLVRKTLADPLFCGWLYQTILMERKEDYSNLRQQKSTDALSRITQWFTPSWICDFLLDECFPHADGISNGEEGNDCTSVDDFKTTTFLDSACGAGHILTPAFLRLLQNRLLAANLPEAEQLRRFKTRWDETEDFAASADLTSIMGWDHQVIADHMSAILSSQLYGLDTDPLMIRLSGLAIYLTCRDVSKTAPLPTPLLFSFENRSDSEPLNKQTPDGNSTVSLETAGETVLATTATNGSLLVSLDPRPGDVLLRQLGGNLKSLDELPKSFDVQTLNPPYLSHRLMPGTSAKFLRENYDGSQYDLYTAFLELSIRLMGKQGRLALICQQSFLSTSRFEHLRRKLVERCHINSIAQLGAGAFASRGGEKVSNAIISLSRKDHSTTEVSDMELVNPPRLSVYKLVSASAKRQAEQAGVQEFAKVTVSERELLATTAMIPGFPFVPFCPQEIAVLFRSYQTIAQSDNGIVLTNGLFTCDNKRFVRHFLDFYEDNPANYVPYDKGGGQKWFSTTPYLLKWKNNGDDIRRFRLQRGQSKALPGERFYFKDGITYSYIGTRGFKARLLTPGSVFDIASSAMFSEQIDLYYLLGFLNSALTRFILGMLNPTVNFQIGDLRRIPFCPPSKKIEIEVARLAKEAVNLAREAETFDNSSSAYNRALALETIRSRAQEINHSELQLQNEIDEAIFDLYKISGTTRDTIRENEWVARTQGDLVTIPEIASQKV